MDSVKTISIEDGLEASRPVSENVVEVTPFIGCWLSTNKDTQGIAKLIVTHDENGLRVRAFGAGVPSLQEWGEVKGTVFADSATSNVGRAFRALYDLGFKETILQAKVKKGVLVVANFNRFKDGSRRANYFSREFFYRAAV
jgi:hypothetical protein